MSDLDAAAWDLLGLSPGYMKQMFGEVDPFDAGGNMDQAADAGADGNAVEEMEASDATISGARCADVVVCEESAFEPKCIEGALSALHGPSGRLVVSVGHECEQICFSVTNLFACFVHWRSWRTL